MNTLPYYELHKICRICLKNDLLVSIYRPTYLMAPTPIIMIEKLNIFKPDDKLPSLLCQSCLYRLLDAYNLQQLAVASAERLTNFLINKGNCSIDNETNNGREDTTVASARSYNSHFKNSTSVAATTITCDVPNANNIYTNLCDINDIEIDVSSLTRSEADESLSDVFFKSNIQNKHDRNIELDNTNIDLDEQAEQVSAHKAATISKVCHKSVKKFHRISKICMECGKSFKYQSALETHKRVHTSEKPFACTFCDRRFKQKSNLQIHQQTHAPANGSNDRRFQCELCAALFRTSSNLKAHQSTHLQECAFQCDRCERRFKTARELRRHQPIHKTIKDVVCEMCDKRFTKQSYLNAHIALVHRGIKRYKCAECGKIFGSQTNLKCHMRIHSGEKPFECKQCNWKFNQSSALRRHMQKYCKSQMDAVVTKFQMPTDVLPNEQTVPDYALSHLSHLDGLSMSGDEMVEVGVTGNESELVVTPAYEFGKENILNFSTPQTAAPSNQQPAAHY